MATITVSDINNGDALDASVVSNNFTTIVNEFNGNIDNNNIKSGANIATNKLAAEAWSAFTPTATNITQGTGTYDCAYFQLGKMVAAQYKFTLGGTSAIGSGVTLTLPVTAKKALAFRFPVQLQDTGNASYNGAAVNTSTTVLRIYANAASGSYVTDADLSSTVPFTWGTNDVIEFTIVYEAA